MRGLYKATAMVIVDANLRAKVSALAKTSPTTMPLPLTDQPDKDAVEAIDKLFQAKGLHLPIYDLCELNRWFVADKPAGAFSAVLDKFRTAMKNAIDLGSAIQSPGFLEALGVLVVDPLLRSEFVLKTRNLTDMGFTISSEEEEALRSAAPVGGPADVHANAIHDLGWPGGSCLSAMLRYPDYVHPNR